MQWREVGLAWVNYLIAISATEDFKTKGTRCAPINPAYTATVIPSLFDDICLHHDAAMVTLCQVKLNVINVQVGNMTA